MRTLFLGGCHAQILQKVFKTKFPDEIFDALINFEEIAAGRKFKIDTMASYNNVVLSPIINQPGWETQPIVDHLKRNKVNVVVYPWVQWDGYFPWFEKVPFLGRSNWFCSEHSLLYPITESRGNLRPSHKNLKHAIVNATERTSRRLRMAEREGSVDFKISEFILDRFKEQRLFLTPDHPSSILYAFLVGEIASRIGKDISTNDLIFAEELQPDLLLPISSIVQDALCLNFSSPYFIDKSIKNSAFSIAEYSLIHKYCGQSYKLFICKDPKMLCCTDVSNKIRTSISVNLEKIFIAKFKKTLDEVLQIEVSATITGGKLERDPLRSIVNIDRNCFDIFEI